MYVARSKLRKHLTHVHTENGKFECDEFNVLFNKNTDFTVHNKNVHAINHEDT